MIQLITFDLDNTLWDVEPALIRAEQAQHSWLLEHRPRAAQKFDDKELLAFKKAVWKRHPELSHNMTAMRKQSILELQVEAGYSLSDAQEGAEAAFAVFLEQRHQVELYAGAIAVLAALAERYTLGALTNGNADIYKTEAAPYFKFAFLAEEVGASKPAPDLFHAALEHTGASPQETVHVGDDPNHDILGAQQVGMRTVWVNGRNKEWPEIAPPDGEITELDELPEVIENLSAKQ